MFAINQYNEGVHAPDIDGVILGRATSSDIVYFEQIGRALSVKGRTKEQYDYYETLSREELIKIAKDEDNFKEIYKLLKEYHFYYINDIILNYIEIFSLDKEEVEQKIKELKEKFGNNYVYLIGDDMRALDYILI